MDQCQCLKSDGVQCTRTKSGDTQYCWQHHSCSHPVGKGQGQGQGKGQVQTRCEKLGLLTHHRNSCYCDSALYAILFQDNEYITTQFLNSTKHHKYLGLPDDRYTIIERMRWILGEVKLAIQKGQTFQLDEFRVLQMEYQLTDLVIKLISYDSNESRKVIYHNIMGTSIKNSRHDSEKTLDNFIDDLWMAIAEIVDEYEIKWDLQNFKDIKYIISEFHRCNKVVSMYLDQQMAPQATYTSNWIKSSLPDSQLSYFYGNAPMDPDYIVTLDLSNIEQTDPLTIERLLSPPTASRR